MDIIPIASIVRIRNCHLPDLNMFDQFSYAEKYLLEKGFEKVSDDGFYSVYENPEYKNANRNTILHVSGQDHIMGRIFSVVEPE